MTAPSSLPSLGLEPAVQRRRRWVTAAISAVCLHAAAAAVLMGMPQGQGPSAEDAVYIEMTALDVDLPVAEEEQAAEEEQQVATPPPEPEPEPVEEAKLEEPPPELEPPPPPPEVEPPPPETKVEEAPKAPEPEVTLPVAEPPKVVEKREPRPEPEITRPVRKVQPKPRPVAKAAPPKGAAKENRAAQTATRKKASGGVSIGAYASQVRARVAARRPSGGGARGTVVISFGVSSGGGLRYARIAKSSGNGSADQRALAAVRGASFPPPPAGATPGQLNFSIAFNYR